MTKEELQKELVKEITARKVAEDRFSKLKKEFADLKKKVATHKVHAEQAERSSYSKDVFLAKMSHEIRTPLNAIMGLGKMLAKSDLDAKQNFLLSSIQTASENLLVIINDILDFSKIEAGKISIEHYGFNLKKTALQALNVFMHKAEEKGLSLFLEMDERIAPVLIGDQYRINQVLVNMLSNAVKFTEAGSVTIKTVLLEEIDEEQKIQIIVKDTGIGINDEYLKKLFEMFSQEDNSVARKFGGSGLGMSISKQLAELMGGTLVVESRKNFGTTVLITFAFKIGKAEDIIQEEEFNGDTNIIHNKKILLVEDNSMNRLITFASLQQHGALISEAENGVQALDLIRKNNFDLILMDVQMPVMGGFEATKIIRNDMKISVPIVALTANALKGDDEKCIKSGMNDFISKPYDEKKLLLVISKWLAPPGKKSDSPAMRQRTSPGGETVSENGNIFNLAKLKTIGNDDFVSLMLQLFAKEIPVSVQKIKEAYASGDFETVKYLIHRIRPSILNMGIEQLKDEVTLIEDMSAAGKENPELEKMINKLEQVITMVINKLRQDAHIQASS